MRSITHNTLEFLIMIHYLRRLPFYIWGATGIGKSRTVRRVSKQIAKKLNLEYSEHPDDINDTSKFMLIDRRVSQMEPSDLLGIPHIAKIYKKDANGKHIEEERELTKWIPPNWLPSQGQGIIFLDELNLAPPSIQSAAYQLILDRRLGDYILPDGFVVLAAGNRMQDKANVFELANPLSNRFDHVELKIPGIEDWIEWAQTEGDIDHRIQIFLKFRPALLHKEAADVRDKAFPTGRSWERASLLIKDVENVEEGEVLVATAVGEGAASELRAFLKLTKKIDIREIMENPEKIKLIKSIDMKYATISALIGYYKKDAKILRVMLQVAKEMEPEFGILLLRNVKQKEPRFFSREVVKISEWKELSKEVTKYCGD